jgi:formate dehydrogenase subunit delta
MSADTIIRMANQISTFFRTAEKEDAPKHVAAHINDFWDPRMRAQLHELLKTRAEAFNTEVVAASDDIR